MAVYFLDSSAVVKRYIREAGTAWIINTTNPSAGNRIYLARITGVEVVSAISRQKRAGTLSTTTAETAIAQFREDLTNQYRVVEMTRLLTERAMKLAETYALRGYDAVQLAAGLEVHTLCQILGISPFFLVSADKALNEAGTQEELILVDPNTPNANGNSAK